MVYQAVSMEVSKAPESRLLHQISPLRYHTERRVEEVATSEVGLKVTEAKKANVVSSSVNPCLHPCSVQSKQPLNNVPNQTELPSERNQQMQRD